MRLFLHKQFLATWIGVVACCRVFSVDAANPDAGLPPVPQWTQTDQLKQKWSKISLEKLRAEAEKGNPEAEHLLASSYFSGVGMTKDLKLAAEWYRKAAEQGFALAQNNLGALFQSGQGVPKDLAESIRWFRKAADQGLPVALKNLGELAARGESPDLQPSNAQKFYEMAAERGNCEAAMALASSLIWGGIPEAPLDWKLGAYWFAFAAKNGCIMAYNNLGWLYLDGLGVPKDFDETLRWFEKGAKLDEPYCYFGLGMHELVAHEELPDLDKARSWLLKAAEKNIPKAWFQLGRLSELRNIAHNSSAKPDYVEAAKWYQLAADKGIKEAAQRLAELKSEHDIGTSADALTLLQKSSDFGNRKAQLQLAQLYLSGKAKPRSAADDPLALLQSLVHAGNPLGELALAELYRTGQRVPKDPVLALYFIHSALIAASDDDGGAYARFYDLKESMEQKRPVATFNRGLEEVFPLYFDAVYNNQNNTSALRIARNYLDGTYPTNEIAACAWFTLAVRRNSAEAVSERDRLRQKLNETDRREAEKMEARIHSFFQLGAP